MGSIFTNIDSSFRYFTAKTVLFPVLDDCSVRSNLVKDREVLCFGFRSVELWFGLFFLRVVDCMKSLGCDDRPLSIHPCPFVLLLLNSKKRDLYAYILSYPPSTVTSDRYSDTLLTFHVIISPTTTKKHSATYDYSSPRNVMQRKSR